MKWKNMNPIEFNIVFRSPKYPVIVISMDRLYSAFNIKQLAESRISSIAAEDRKIIQVIYFVIKLSWILFFTCLILQRIACYAQAVLLVRNVS